MKVPDQRGAFRPHCEYKKHNQAKVNMKQVLKPELNERDPTSQWKGLRLRKVEVV
jgi:hypothetical protein